MAARFSLFTVGLLVLALIGFAVSPPIEGGEKPIPIQISWFGQSFFTIKSSKGTVLATDPHFIPEFGRIEGIKADVILVSHNHTDHTQIQAIENAMDKNVKTLRGITGITQKGSWNPITETVKDFKIRNVGTYHDELEGMMRGRNSVFIIEVDGWTIAHLGDLGHLLSEDQIKKIGPVDVVMIPVGGIYTLNGAQAKKVVEQLRPKEYIFPMHYGNKVYDTLLPIDEFLEDQPRANISSSQDNTVLLNKDGQRPRPLIVQLNHAPKK